MPDILLRSMCPILVLAPALALGGCSGPRAADPTQPNGVTGPAAQVDLDPAASRPTPTSSSSGAPASSAASPAGLPSLGAACRGMDIDLAKVAAASECAVDAAVAKRFAATEPMLSLEMTHSPKQLKYGSPISITLSATNKRSVDVPVVLVIDEPGNIGYVLFEAQALWRLPPAPVVPAKEAERFAMVVLSQGATARWKIDTQLRPMQNSFDMSCTGVDCPRYVDVTWDPGSSLPAGKHRLRAYIDGIVTEDEWVFDVDVTR